MLNAYCVTRSRHMMTERLKNAIENPPKSPFCKISNFNDYTIPVNALIVNTNNFESFPKTIFLKADVRNSNKPKSFLFVSYLQICCLFEFCTSTFKKLSLNSFYFDQIVFICEWKYVFPRKDRSYEVRESIYDMTSFITWFGWENSTYTYVLLKGNFFEEVFKNYTAD